MPKYSSKHNAKKPEGEQKTNGIAAMFDRLIEYAKVIESSDWKMGWQTNQASWRGLPQNISGREYTGGNSFYLMMATMANNYSMPVFATFNQINKLNEHLMDDKGRIPKDKWDQAVHVNKGEQSEYAIFSTVQYKNTEDPKEKPLTREQYLQLPKEDRDKYEEKWINYAHAIFNVDQTNMREVRPELYEKLKERMGIEQRENFLQDTKGMYAEPAIDYILQNQTWRCPVHFTAESREAFYSPSKDEITIPKKEQFNIPYTEKDLERDIKKILEPAEKMKTVIHDFSEADRNLSNLRENKDNKEYKAELRATLMLEDTFGQHLGIFRQDGQTIKDYAQQINKAINDNRENIIALKDQKAKITGGKDYYATFVHEGAHSMGKELNIKLNESGDKKGYAREELRAESSAAIIAATMGYGNTIIFNSAAYIRGWNETASVGEKTKQMKQLQADINSTVKRMGEIIDDAAIKAGQQPIFNKSLAEKIPDKIDQNQQTTQTAAETQTTDQKVSQHETVAPAQSDQADQKAVKSVAVSQQQPKTSIPYPKQQTAHTDKVAETPAAEQQAQLSWNKLSALLMDTNEDIHLKAKKDEILVLETDEDMGLSDLEKNHLSEVWQHPSEGIITFKMEGSNQEFDLSDYPEFIPQIYNHVADGTMEMISVKQQLEDKLIALSQLAAQTPKDRQSDIVFIREFDPDRMSNIYTAYGKDADRLAEKVSSSVAVMRPEIDGQRYPNATVNSGNLDAVRSDMMLNNVHPVIIDTNGNRITDDKKLDYTKEERKAFLDSLKPENKQRENIADTLKQLGNPERIAIPHTGERPIPDHTLMIPQRFGYQEIALSEVIRSKDGTYKAGNSEDGYYPITKMDTNNLFEVQQALQKVVANRPQNLVNELLNQVQNGKAEVSRDNAEGRYIITINDKQGERNYPRGFKQFTVGQDMQDHLLLHNDQGGSRASMVKVNTVTVQQLVNYAESKLGISQSQQQDMQKADQKAGQTASQQVTDTSSHNQGSIHNVRDFSVRNINGEWKLQATVNDRTMPTATISTQDMKDYRAGRMSQQALLTKTYGDQLNQKEDQTQHRGRGR
ncbi:MAG: DUF1738 domain-containing protein [Bacteroidales bacterium]|nr:DUF1738 domain-containing protein [Bacteroidales bacterium]